MSEYKYWAFISYSHQDEDWAKWLHHELETYKIPKRLVGKPSRWGALPERLFPVFRDRAELSTSARLDTNIRRALTESRYLIVVCSPHSARSRWVGEEIKIFKSMGRGDQVLCLIVEGQPCSGNELECFPLPVRFEVDSEGQLSNTPVEPLAADAQKHKDGKDNSLLKLLSGMMEVGFDELRQRERQRKRRRTTRTVMAVSSFVVLLYILAADANVSLPQGDGMRRVLDHYNLTLLRRPYSETKIHRASLAVRDDLFKQLYKSQGKDAWMSLKLTGNEGPKFYDTWTQPQALFVMLQNPDIHAGELKNLLRGLDVQFKEGPPVEYKGVKYGWRSNNDVSMPQAEPTLWTAAAVAAALGRPELTDKTERQKFQERLAYVQDALNRYYVGNDGGWNQYPLQKNPAQHNLYSTTLALLVLLEMHKSKVGWQGSTQKRDELTKATANWLMKQYSADSQPPGWLGFSDRDNPTIDGLTLQNYAELLRAENDLKIPLTPEIRERVPQHLAACVERSLNYPVEKDEYSTKIKELDGTERRDPQLESVNFLWYPWAIDAATRWLQTYGKTAANEDRVRVQRALGHMVVNLGPEAVKKYTSSYTFVASETLYGFNHVATSDSSGVGSKD